MTMIDPLDKYITLAEAAEEMFGGQLGADGFRAWATEHGVPIIRRRKHFVTLRQCLEAQGRHDSSSIKNAEPGSSGTALGASEQVAALNAKLRVNSRNTSPTRTSLGPNRRRSSAQSYSPISNTGQRNG
jgi:hypothetical protein